MAKRFTTKLFTALALLSSSATLYGQTPVPTQQMAQPQQMMVAPQPYPAYYPQQVYYQPPVQHIKYVPSNAVMEKTKRGSKFLQRLQVQCTHKCKWYYFRIS
jgi:hypothetical protein